MSQTKMLSEIIFRLIDEKFREGLVPCSPVFVDVVELPGEAWRGLWRVTAWGTPGEIASDVDVEASGEIDALEKARAAFGARTTDEWRERMPVAIGEDDPSLVAIGTTTPPDQQRVCAGPVYFADQGIEVCTSCGGCICCDFADVDHSRAEYECFTDREGVCHLYAHEGRPCTNGLPPKASS